MARPSLRGQRRGLVPVIWGGVQGEARPASRLDVQQAVRRVQQRQPPFEMRINPKRVVLIIEERRPGRAGMDYQAIEPSALRAEAVREASVARCATYRSSRLAAEAFMDFRQVREANRRYRNATRVPIVPPSTRLSAKQCFQSHSDSIEFQVAISGSLDILFVCPRSVSLVSRTSPSFFGVSLDENQTRSECLCTGDLRWLPAPRRKRHRLPLLLRLPRRHPPHLPHRLLKPPRPLPRPLTLLPRLLRPLRTLPRNSVKRYGLRPQGLGLKARAGRKAWSGFSASEALFPG